MGAWTSVAYEKKYGKIFIILPSISQANILINNSVMISGYG